MKTNTPEKYFINQLDAHSCQLPPSDDYQFVRRLKPIKNFFLISDRSLGSYLKAKSLSGIYYEKRRQVRTTQVVIHPFSKFRKMWIIWMSFVLLGSSIMLPFFAAFLGPVYVKHLIVHQKPFLTYWLVLYIVLIIQLACIADIIVNFFTGYSTKSPEEMVIQPWRIVRSYLFSHFLFDLASSLPIDFILITVLGAPAYSNLQKALVFGISALPFIKLTRLYTLYKYCWVVYSMFSSSESNYKVFCVTITFFLFIHWATCITLLISQFVYFDMLFDDRYVNSNYSWIFEMRFFDRCVLSMYVCAWYRAVSCINGLGLKLYHSTNIEDKILFVILGIIGGIYLLFLLVFFLQATSSVARAKMTYSEIIDQVNEYMEFKKFPKELKKKVREYYLCLYQKHYTDENAVLKLASDSLRKEILLRMHQRLVENVNIFSGLSQNITMQILSKLKPEIYREGEVAVRFGEFCDCMFFVSFGTFALYSGEGIEIGHMDDGNYFGDMSLLLNIPSQVTVLAVETSLVYRFNSADFKEIVRSEKSLANKLEKNAEAWWRKINQMHKKVLRKETEKKEKGQESDFDDESFDDSD